MEKEYTIRGFYRPHFFSLFINGEFNIDLSEISKTDLGTFVHEYIHYLQNLTTIFGLRNSMFYFSYLYEVKKHIAENDKIEIPIKIDFSETIKNGQIRFNLSNGSTKIFSPEYDDVKLYISTATEKDVTINVLVLELYKEGEKIENLIVGNNFVKESMARLYQQLFDNEVEHPTFPYKTAEILCKVLNPDLLKDKRKLIAICLLSLNSQNSGYTLYDLIIRTQSDKELNAIDLYKKYLNEFSVINNNEKITIKDFLLQSLDKFEEILSSSIVADINHFKLMIENIKYSAEKNILPLIDILFSDMENIEKLKEIIDFYGIPHIRTISGYNFFPLNQEQNKPAEEYIELLGQQAVFERILELGKDKKMCSLFPVCQLSEDDVIDENCFNEQWKRTKPCPFKIISDNWKLNEKIE